MSSAHISPTLWNDALVVTKQSDGLYHADFPSDFCYGTRAHGGLMASLVGKALDDHFSSTNGRPRLPDILELKVHCLVAAKSGSTLFKIEELVVSKRNATVVVRVEQEGALKSAFLINVGDLSQLQGPRFETNWKLTPPPFPADFNRMSADEDPAWISYLTPWHPESVISVWTHVKQFFPYSQYTNETIRDVWLTPVDPHPSPSPSSRPTSSPRWTTAHIPFIADMTMPPLENFQGSKAGASHSAMLRLARQQGADRASCKQSTDSWSGFAPYTSFATSMNVDIRKKLPDEDVKWLFARADSRVARDGKMDFDVTVCDEAGDVVAIVYVVNKIVDMERNVVPGGARMDRKLKVAAKI